MHTTPPSLLMRVRDPGDHAAWEDLDRRYRGWLIRFFRRKNIPLVDAEDLAQRVFVGLSKGLPQFSYDPSRGRFRDYLYRCAKNALAEWARCPARNGSPLLLDMARIEAQSGDNDPADAQVWEEEWVNHHCSRALETLRTTASDRDVALLERCLAGASLADLAREFGMEPVAAQKARQRLRKKMEELIAAQIAEEDRVDD